MKEIRLGLEEELPVLTYAKKEFDARQMEQIRLALKEDLDVSEVAKVYFEWKQAEQRRLKRLREKQRKDAIMKNSKNL